MVTHGGIWGEIVILDVVDVACCMLLMECPFKHHQRDFVNKNRSWPLPRAGSIIKMAFCTESRLVWNILHAARHDAQSIRPYRETISTPDGRELELLWKGYSCWAAPKPCQKTHCCRIQ